MNTQPEWFSFQEIVRDFFVGLGLDAKTNVTVKGIRTTHDIDVLVKTKFLGQEVIWIVEAKHLSSRVSKLHVMGLRQIVEDIGADKGFIISKNGFQKGAIEATKNTNIRLLTFEELMEISKDYVEEEILKHYLERIALIDRRYWSHKKGVRIDYELRHEYAELNYSIPFVLQTGVWAIKEAYAKRYPIDLNTHLKEKHGVLMADNFQQLLNWLNLNFNVIDKKILDAEMKMQKDGRFNPVLGDDESIHLMIFKAFRKGKP
jgi:Restriction endonuclease